VKAAQYVASHPGEVCPAKWTPGADTLKPSLDLVGRSKREPQELKVNGPAPSAGRFPSNSSQLKHTKAYRSAACSTPT